MPAATIQIDVHLGGDDLRAALRDDARRCLTSTPKELPPKWFYDDRGSRLFERITRLPEYYPTRREREILLARADDTARRTAADTLVELGSGTSEKTRILLDALRAAGTLQRFAPFDVSEATLRAAAAAVASEYPGVAVHGVVGDFQRHLGQLPTGGRRLIAFLGGTIGNLVPEARGRFLASLGGGLAADDRLLIGFDVVKDVGRLEAAYDDPGGVTAEFNRNVLYVLNRELQATFQPERFRHVARWDAAKEWMEMLLVSDRDQVVEVPTLGLSVEFAEGEEMRTEISAKFRGEGVTREAAAAGLKVEQWWTDRACDFAVALLAR